MRILHVITAARAEGTPRLVLDWLRSGEPVEQDVLCLHDQPNQLAEAMRQHAGQVRVASLLGRSKIRKVAGIIDQTRGMVRRRRPDLVICWNTGFAGWVAIGTRAGGCHRFLAHAGNPAARGRRADGLTRYVVWPIVLTGGKIVCCSDYVRRSIASVPGVPDRSIRSVHNCCDVSDVARRAAGARQNAGRNSGQNNAGGPIGIMVATLEGHKDHATLLAAVRRIVDRIAGFQLWLAGEGSLRGEIESLIAESEIGGHVELLGSRDDVPELLGRADLFVLSTTPREGFGSVLLEALAAGLPIIASDVPACRETLGGGRWGTLVPAGDSAEMARAVLDQLSRPADSKARRAAADYAAQFTPQRMMRQYLEIAGLPQPGDR